MRIQSLEIRSSERADATFKAEREMQSGKDDRPDDAKRWREGGGGGRGRCNHCIAADRSVDRTRTRTAAAPDEAAAAAREEVMDGMGMRVGGRAAAAVHGGAARGAVHDRASERPQTEQSDTRLSSSPVRRRWRMGRGGPREGREGRSGIRRNNGVPETNGIRRHEHSLSTLFSRLQTFNAGTCRPGMGLPYTFPQNSLITHGDSFDDT